MAPVEHLAEIALLALPLAVAADLVRRARGGTRVPLAVWLIPGTLAVDLAGVWTVVRLADGALGGAALHEVARGSGMVLYGAALLLAGEAAVSGLAGPDRDAKPTVWRESAARAGGIGGVLAVVVGSGSFGEGSVAAGLEEPLVWVVSGAVVAAGIGAAGSLQRRTPSSYPLVPGILAGTAIVLAAAAERVFGFAAAAQAGEAGGFAWTPPGPAVALVAGSCAMVGIAVWLAIRRARKPWKWGTLGDIMLFVFVTVLFVAGLGGTLQKLQRATGSTGPHCSRSRAVETTRQLLHDEGRRSSGSSRMRMRGHAGDGSLPPTRMVRTAVGSGAGGCSRGVGVGFRGGGWSGALRRGAVWGGVGGGL